ncbi:MAG: tripartite tricarboxylate transporter substrate binding protein [Betaproteobacteria bacterium]|nr:tripartite tricarboxylate transporter substrate binding protein [Betaproteobacteria bacterium]
MKTACALLATGAFRKIGTGATAALAVLACVPAPAQEYPSKPVRIIIGFPPGGATDLVSRLMAPKYVAAFKQQFIVDNRPGANGVIGSDLAAKAAPDGHTIHLATIGSLVISPAIGKVPYDPLKDFAPISQAVALQNIFIVHPTLPARTLKELIALARAKPRALNYATSGQGSPGHLAAELFKNMAKVNIVHVPYKGGGPALTDLVAGHVEIFVAVISTAMPQVEAGKARALAVTGGKRAVALPDVPTVAETGLKGYEATNWYGYLAPAATPRAIIERLHKETVAILNLPDVKKTLLNRGIDAVPSSPEQFAAHIRKETDKWTKVIKEAGLKAN